jgi:hypothetical protein
MTRHLAMLVAGLICAACSEDKAADRTTAQADAPAGCIAGGGGFLHAQLRGAVVADLDWSNAEMQCAGGPRPDGQGLRVTFAGKLPGADGAPARQLRFIFGVDRQDVAVGTAKALPTNLTVIVEGEAELYATRGAGNCAVEALDRTPLDGTDGKQERVRGRGYCIGPATNLAGNARLLVPTFEFTGVADTRESP